MKMATTHLEFPVEIHGASTPNAIDAAFLQFDIKRALEHVMLAVAELDAYIQSTEPFKVVKINPKKEQRSSRKWSNGFIASRPCSTHSFPLPLPR